MEELSLGRSRSGVGVGVGVGADIFRPVWELESEMLQSPRVRSPRLKAFLPSVLTPADGSHGQSNWPIGVNVVHFVRARLNPLHFAILHCWRFITF